VRTTGLRLLVTVTFNPNQLRAHLEPIVALDEVEEVVLVSDREPPPLPKVRTILPDRRVVRIIGRAGAKLVTCIRVARRERPEWVIGFNLVPHGINAYLAARAAGVRSLYAMIGGPVEWDEGGWRSDNAILGRLPRPMPLLERLLLGVVRGCDVVAAMGEAGRTALVAHGVRPERAVVLPPAIDVDRFRPAGAATRRYDVLTVGSLIDTKRQVDLIEAAAIVRATYPGLRLAIVGEGPLEGELREAARRRGLDGAVEFLGFREDVEGLYAAASVFALPSRYEGLSVALGEAMASGLPAVVADVGELRELVLDGENGFVVPVADPEALADRLRRLLEDGELRDAFAARAVARAREVVASARVAGLYGRILLGGPSKHVRSSDVR
jgi:glycosyltransferase involved in cell wall biosynthesis